MIRASDYVAPVIPESGSVFVTGRYVGSATVLEVATAAPVCSVPFVAINSDQAEPNLLVQDLLENAVSSAARALAAPPQARVSSSTEISARVPTRIGGPQ